MIRKGEITRSEIHASASAPEGSGSMLIVDSEEALRRMREDPLTGLYRPEFFYHFAREYDRLHPDTETDAIILEIDRFGILQDRYGQPYADRVLRRISEKLQEMIPEDEGLLCRAGTSIFYLYCIHRNDYKALLDKLSRSLSDEHHTGGRVRLHMGICARADRSLAIEERFERAQLASDSVRKSLTRTIGIYDDAMRRIRLHAAQLMEDFRIGLKQEQFQVYYQPKFDIRDEQPLLTGAEALVRWNHPLLGMLTPASFIPIFEENGLISELDSYVWDQTARQIREWKDRYGFCIPVSVNVSRIDLYDHNIVYTLMSILERYHLDNDDLHLEIPEIAYTEDPDQVLEAVKRLRAVGFCIELDDFGTGQSSLGMLGALPIDALKLDILFIRSAFAEETDTKMLEILIGIAKELGIPAIAEGVEDEEEMRILREIGCGVAQGYHFSAPVPAQAFRPFLEDLQQRLASLPQADREADDPEAQSVRWSGSDESEEPAPHKPDRHLGISLHHASVLFVMVAVIIAVALFLTNMMVTDGYHEMELAGDNFIKAEQATKDLEIGSDYLTDQVRLFAVNKDIRYMNNYFRELNETKRRDNAVTDLKNLMQGDDNAAYEHLSAALRLSNELVDYEYHSMKLVISAEDFASAEIPEVLAEYELPEKERSFTNEEKLDLASRLVLGKDYQEYKDKIKSSTTACTKYLTTASAMERVQANRHLGHLMVLQAVFIILLLMTSLAIVLFMSVRVRKPLNRMASLMKARQETTPDGVQEVGMVSNIYNEIREEMRRTRQRLTYGDMLDSLTGLYNRNAYELIRHDIDMSNNALLLVDVDHFQLINDEYGSETGDRVLKRVAEVLEYQFRSTDLLFRVTGDEFIIIMTFVDSSMRTLVETKIRQANEMLQKAEGDLPPVTISVGAAFADRKNPEGDIFQDADTALYVVKRSDQRGCYIY